MLQFYSHRTDGSQCYSFTVTEGWWMRSSLRGGGGMAGEGGRLQALEGKGRQLQVKIAGAGWRALREHAAASSSCPQTGAPPPHAHWHKR